MVLLGLRLGIWLRLDRQWRLSLFEDEYGLFVYLVCFFDVEEEVVVGVFEVSEGL